MSSFRVCGQPVDSVEKLKKCADGKISRRAVETDTLQSSASQKPAKAAA
jgi:hypothetical protein